MPDTTVKHVGIILDGNRRWAKRQGKKGLEGHTEGAQRVEELLQWCKDLGLKELSLYVFSMQNFQREEEEVGHLFTLFRQWFKKLSKKLEEESHDARIRFLGRTYLFPKDVQEIIEDLTERTKNNKTYTLNFCMGYGGREEIVDAVKAVAMDVKQGLVNPAKIDASVFENYLYMADQPELIIRTGGVCRTSNFLIWQSFYSEWFFLDKTWPEFSKEDLQNILKEFSKRERRFGR